MDSVTSDLARVLGTWLGRIHAPLVKRLLATCTCPPRMRKRKGAEPASISVQMAGSGTQLFVVTSPPFVKASDLLVKVRHHLGLPVHAPCLLTHDHGTRKLSGNRLLAKLDPRTVTVVRGGKCVPKLKGHVGAVANLVVSHDGQWLVSFSLQNHLYVWDLQSRQRVWHADATAELLGCFEQYWKLPYLRVSAGGDRIWVKTGCDIYTWTRAGPHIWRRTEMYMRSLSYKQVHTLAAAADDTVVAQVRDSGLVVHDARGSLLWTASAKSVRNVRVTRDGAFCATCESDRDNDVVRVYHVRAPLTSAAEPRRFSRTFQQSDRARLVCVWSDTAKRPGVVRAAYRLGKRASGAVLVEEMDMDTGRTTQTWSTVIGCKWGFMQRSHGAFSLDGRRLFLATGGAVLEMITLHESGTVRSQACTQPALKGICVVTSTRLNGQDAVLCGTTNGTIWCLTDTDFAQDTDAVNV